MNKEQKTSEIATISGQVYELGEANGNYVMLSDKDGECILLSGVSNEVCGALSKRLFNEVEIVIREVID